MDQSCEFNEGFQQAWNGAFGGQANLDKSTAIQLQSTIMDLFMDLVECMGAEVAQQPQMREASQGLLTQSLHADKQANAELTESGLRLLTTLFVNDPGGAENYKVMIAQPVLFDLTEASLLNLKRESLDCCTCQAWWRRMVMSSTRPQETKQHSSLEVSIGAYLGAIH